MPDSDSNALINSPGSVVHWSINNEGTPYLNVRSLTVGSGSGNTGYLVTNSDANASGSINTADGVIIGSQGGHGQFDLSFPAFSLDNYQHFNIYAYENPVTLAVGAGSGSTGTMNVLGSGKTTQMQNSNNFQLDTNYGGVRVGTDGGNGTVNVVGGAWGTGSYTNDGSPGTVIGNGAGSVGTVNILSGGKMAASVSSGGADQPLIAGLNGGTGTLNVTGVAENGAISRVTLGAGLTLGDGSGSTGNMNVLAGGKVLTYANNQGDPNIPLQLPQLGVNGGTGNAAVSGAGSVWYVGGVQSFGDPEEDQTGHLHVGVSGTGSLTIADGGLVSIGVPTLGYVYEEDETTGQFNSYYTMTSFAGGLGNLYLADEAGSTGVLNIGAPAGAAAAAPGTLDAAAVVFGAGNGKIVFNHTSGDYPFDVPLLGAGTIETYAGTTRLDIDNSGFSGTADLYGGTLAVMGTLGGQVDVHAGGTLAGTGIVGNTLVRTGGTISPGFNSPEPSTLNINGNLAFQPGAVYAVDIADPPQSDLINISGTATLGGATVIVTPQGGGYALDSRWKILSAAGGVNGTFGPLLESLPFLDFSYVYDPNNVYLQAVRNSVSFCLPGMSANQCTTGSAVEALGQSNVLYDAVASQASADAAARAFDLLSGEIHASIKSAQIEDSRFLREAVNNRLSGAINDSATDAGPSGVWAHAFGSWGEFRGNSNAADLNRDIGGVFVGGDRQITPVWRVGAAGGYSRSDYDIGDRNSSGTSDSYHLALYAGGQWDRLSLRTGLGYSWHDISTTRSAVFPGFSEQLSADYNAATVQVFGELGYRLDAGPVALEPIVSAAYVNLHTDSFTEQGGAAALQSPADNTDLIFSTLGLRGKSKLTLGNGTELSLHGMLGWRHAYGDVDAISSLRFDGGNLFNIYGVAIARDAAAVELGVDAAFSRTFSAGVVFSGQYGNGASDNGVKAYVNWRF